MRKGRRSPFGMAQWESGRNNPSQQRLPCTTDPNANPTQRPTPGYSIHKSTRSDHPTSGTRPARRTSTKKRRPERNNRDQRPECRSPDKHTQASPHRGRHAPARLIPHPAGGKRSLQKRRERRSPDKRVPASPHHGRHARARLVTETKPTSLSLERTPRDPQPDHPRWTNRDQRPGCRSPSKRTQASPHRGRHAPARLIPFTRRGETVAPEATRTLIA